MRKYNADKALKTARESVHGFFGDRTSPFCDPPTDVVPDRSFIRLLEVKDSEVEDILKNNPYNDLEELDTNYPFLCPHCKSKELNLVLEDMPYNPEHYQCNKCDSTYTKEEILNG